MKNLNIGYNWLHTLAKEKRLLKKLIDSKTNNELYKDKWISILKYLVNYINKVVENNNFKSIKKDSVIHLQQINRYLYFLDNINKDRYKVPLEHKFRDFDYSISLLDIRNKNNNNNFEKIRNIFEFIKSININGETYDAIVEKPHDVYDIQRKDNSYYI